MRYLLLLLTKIEAQQVIQFNVRDRDKRSTLVGVIHVAVTFRTTYTCRGVSRKARQQMQHTLKRSIKTDNTITKTPEQFKKPRPCAHVSILILVFPRRGITPPRVQTRATSLLLPSLPIECSRPISTIRKLL